MKKLIIILSVLTLSCTKQETPQPKLSNSNTTPSQTMATYDFNGNWDCYNWVINDMTGETQHRRFILSGQTSTHLSVSLNAYYSNGTFNQLLNGSSAIVDSNYFNDSFNPIQQSFKGVLTSDTTLMIYHYEVDGIGLIDTFQVKEFIKH
ncbi:MAG: hypothetical protein HRT87_06380 [Legionellales bacterium]|nr:hypothetical protein [Legionellales bacterium]